MISLRLRSLLALLGRDVMIVLLKLLGLLLLIAPISSARAEQISVLIPDLPTIATEAGEGREIDLITDIFDRCGYQPVFILQPLARHWQSFELGIGDAVSTVPLGMDLGGFASNIYVLYQNGVTTLSDAVLWSRNLKDLAGKRVMGFSGASRILPGLDRHVPSFADYIEVSNQIIQSRSLFANRVDAVISDGLILAEYNRRLLQRGDVTGVDATQSVLFRSTFPPTPYRMVFRDPAQMASFDRCFDEATEAGAIDRINTAWVDRYRDVLGNEYLGY